MNDVDNDEDAEGGELGEEIHVCDECGGDFYPSESNSHKHCQECLDVADLNCIVCGCELTPDENEGDDSNPLCSTCEIDEMD